MLLYYLFHLFLLINWISTQEQTQCYLLNNKLNKHNIHIHRTSTDFSGLRLCPNEINHHYCCPQSYEKHFQNITANELFRLFELNTIIEYQPLIRLTHELNRKFFFSFFFCI